MSHKVTFKSEFKDAELVKSALESKKYTFRQTGNVFAIEHNQQGMGPQLSP